MQKKENVDFHNSTFRLKSRFIVTVEAYSKVLFLEKYSTEKIVQLYFPSRTFLSAGNPIGLQKVDISTEPVEMARF